MNYSRTPSVAKTSRDYEDMHRKENPLLQAPDAIVMDNTDMTREEQLDFVMKKVEELNPGQEQESRI